MRRIFWPSACFLLTVLLVSFMASLNYLGVVFVMALGGLMGFWRRRLNFWTPPKARPGVAGYSSSVTTANMNQGDFYSGPEGYSANTAYPETQYGSNFDEAAAWNGFER